MTRLRRPVLIPACAVAAALLLTACGGDKPKTTTIVGAQSATPSASASASASAGSSLPDAVLPAGFTIEVDTPSTGDPAKDAVLAANLAYYQAVRQAIGKQDASDTLWQQWTGTLNLEFNAKSSTRAYIQGFINKKHSVIGVLRLYDETVTSLSGEKAAMQWCEDQTKDFAKDLTTGQTLTTVPSRSDFIFYSSILQKNPQGRWITVAIMGKQGDTRCS